MSNQVSIVKSDGSIELFDEEKLENSLKRVGTSQEVVDDIVDEIEKGLKNGMSTADIYGRAFSLLRKYHHPTAVKYSIRRALFELGPDGFPFEKFVARIFKLWGYDAVTDQIVQGVCVPHEMDVVAWKNDELVMAEAKFHNVFGLKSDLKVALYVKARFDDIAGTTFDYGGKQRKISTEGHYLVTNTKFTDMAIKYAVCNNLRLIGWNYPDKDNLHDVIEQNGLHPITALTTITKQEKKDMIGRNVLTCIDLIGNPSILHDIGVKDTAAERILTEAQAVVQQAK
jgi:hypothetical protein